jgi:hypothetical protein
MQFGGSVLRGIRGQRREKSKWQRQKDIYDQKIEHGKESGPKRETTRDRCRDRRDKQSGCLRKTYKGRV